MGAQADWALYKPEDWFDLNAHLRIAGGQSSGTIEELATHGHDPTDEFTVQGFEIEPRLRFNDHIFFAAGINNVLTVDNEFEAELEEAYGSVSDFGFEVRGGRFFNRITQQNYKHLHAWDFVDASLLLGTFLGDENLATDGVELNWVGSTGSFTAGLTASFGEAVTEDHGEEEEDGEAESEEGNFASQTFTSRALLRYDYNDFHRHELGLNFATGENGFGEDTDFYSADYRYLWRENGLEPGGQFFELGGEFFYRSVDFVDEDLATTGDADHYGLSAFTRYGINDWSFGARVDYLEGVNEGAGGDDIYAVEERLRYSIAATYHWELSDQFGGHVRLQGNFDDFEDRGNEQSVFLQLGFDYGGGDGI